MKVLTVQLLAIVMILSSLPGLALESLIVLDLETAYERVVNYSLQLKVSEIERCVKQAETEQVGLRPNPVLTVGVENIGQPRASRRCEEEEFNVGVTQVFELGGKRSARVSVASAEECLALCHLEIAKLDLVAKFFNAYIDVAYAQCLLKLIEDQKKDADETLRCICTKKANGKITPIEEKKAKIACTTFELTWLKTQTQFEMAKRDLAKLWGASGPDFDSVSFPLYELETFPSLESLEACLLANNPELAKSKTELYQASEMQKLERSLRIPDIALFAGVTAYVEQCPTTFSVGFNMPIPVFNQNQGNISRACYKRLQAEYLNLDLEQELKNKLKVLYTAWQAAFYEAETLRDEVLPDALETFQMARDSYSEGKFEYLNLLDARKTLFDVNFQYLEAVTRYQHIKADVERLIASPIETCESPTITPEG